MGLIDTHTHLETFARAGTLPAVLARAQAAGLEALITIGTGLEDWPLYAEMAAAWPGLHYTVGLHPCEVGPEWATAVAEMAAYWQRAVPPVALGECGLDRFHLPKDDPAAAERILGWQREAFAAQLALARSWGCPLQIHSRGAFAETVALIDASGVDWAKVVFHCFSEGPAEMAALLERGGRGSFTGVLTYKNAEAVRAAARAQGLARLMLETDAPYLTPVPHRGKPNEPAYLAFTAAAAATLWGGTLSVAELGEQTTRTARGFFALPPGVLGAGS